ncbi:MAG: OmpA family protein [Nitrospinota bacterium]|nr:OmpA family protein [Nitrospinota bacterium]
MVRENVELIKEQLRSQKMELKKRENEKQKHEAKIKHILGISQKKIEDLKITVTEKDDALQRAESQIPARGFQNESDGPTKEVAVKDPKLVKALKKLQEKNEALGKNLESEQNEKKQLAMDRKLLTKEVKRLNKQPDKGIMKSIKEKVMKMDERSKETKEKYEDLLREKNEQIQSLQASSGEESTEKLKDEIEVLEQEKERLETEFDSKLKEEKAKLEAEIPKGGRSTNLAAQLKKAKAKIDAEWEEKLKKIKGAKVKLKEAIAAEGGGDDWIMTFADMMSLLMVFFILLYSIAAMNVSKFKTAILGEEVTTQNIRDLVDEIEITKSIQELTGMGETDIVPINEEEKVVLSVPSVSLFKPGRADLQQEGRPALDRVIETVKKQKGFKTHIQGHTDDVPIFTDRFPTNWELSAARATAVLRYFIDKGIEPEKLTATGYADTFPLASNDSEIGRSSNRRVEFVLEKER